MDVGVGVPGQAQYGVVIAELAREDTILIGRSTRTVRLMHLAGSSFGETLRLKLHWRGSPLTAFPMTAGGKG